MNVTTRRGSGPEIHVHVRSADVRVEASLRHLLTAEEGIRVVADASPTSTAGRTIDVVVLELTRGSEAEHASGIAALAELQPVVIVGSDASARRAAEGLESVWYLDKSEVSAGLPELVRAVARRGTAGSGAGWPGTLLLTASVFIGPWVVWLSRVAQEHQVIAWHLPQGLALWSILPLLLLAVWLTGGRAALRDLVARVTRFRLAPVLYAIALTVPVAIAAASVATVRILGLQVPLGATLSLPAALAYLGYGTGLFLLTEEAAWRGVLLPRFQGRIGVLAASLAIGAIWAVWHLPLLAAPGEADHGLPRLPFLLLVVSTSVVVSALTTAARGSVVVAAVFHASFDASYAWSGVVSSQHAMIWVAALLTTGLAVFLGWSAPGRRLWISPSESIGGQQ